MSINRLSEKYKALPVQVRASIWFLICSFLQKGISVITTPIFTRILSTDEYGKFGVFNSWYGIITIIVGLSLYQGVHTQGLVKYDQDKKVFTSSLQGLSTLLVTFWVIIYLLFRNFWNNLFSLTTVQMLCMLVLIWTSATFGFWANEQRVNYSYKTLVIVTLIISFAKPLFEIIFILHADDKVTARILAMVLVELLCYSWMFVVQMKRGRKLFSAKYWRHALFFNIPLIPHYLSHTVLNSSDRIMIQRIIGESEAGIYNLAYSLSLIMTIFNTALMQTLSPWIYQKLRDKKSNELSRVAYSTLILIGIVNLLLILLAPEVVAVFAPPSYLPAIWVIPPVAMSVFFMYSYDLFAKFAFYYEKTKFVMLASVIGALLNIVLNYIFIREYGFVAAGYTTLVCYIVYSIAHYLFMRKVCRQFCAGEYPYDTRILLMISIVFVVLGFAFLATYSYPFIRYGIAAIILISIIVFHKRIITFIKELINLKKNI